MGISKVWFRIFSKTLISILSIDSMASSRRMLLKVIILCDSRWVFKSLIWLVCLLVLSLIGEYLGRESGRNFCVFFIMLDWFGFVNNEVFFFNVIYHYRYYYYFFFNLNFSKKSFFFQIYTREQINFFFCYGKHKSFHVFLVCLIWGKHKSFLSGVDFFFCYLSLSLFIFFLTWIFPRIHFLDLFWRIVINNNKITKK